MCELWNQDCASEQDESDNKHDQIAREERAILHQREIDDRIRPVEFPENAADDSDSGGDAEKDDKMRAKPVVSLPFVEDNLQAAKPDRDKRESNEVDIERLLYPLLAGAFDVRRVVYKQVAEKQRQQADGNVDEENPPPGVVVRNPPAESWAHRGRDNNRDAVQRKSHPALLLAECVVQNRLLAGSKPAAAHSLQHSKEDQQLKIWREST